MAGSTDMSKDFEVKHLVLNPGPTALQLYKCKQITVSFNLGFLICKIPTLTLRDRFEKIQ